MSQRKTPRYAPETVTPGQTKQLAAISALEVPCRLSFRHAELLIKGGLQSRLKNFYESLISEFESRPSRFVDVSAVFKVDVPASNGKLALENVPLKVWFDPHSDSRNDPSTGQTPAETIFLHVFNVEASEYDFMQDADKEHQFFTLTQFCEVVAQEVPLGRVKGLRAKIAGKTRHWSAWARFDEGSLSVVPEFGVGVMIPGEAYLFRFPR